MSAGSTPQGPAITEGDNMTDEAPTGSRSNVFHEDISKLVAIRTSMAILFESEPDWKRVSENLVEVGNVVRSKYYDRSDSMDRLSYLLDELKFKGCQMGEDMSRDSETGPESAERYRKFCESFERFFASAVTTSCPLIMACNDQESAGPLSADDAVALVQRDLRQFKELHALEEVFLGFMTPAELVERRTNN